MDLSCQFLGDEPNAVRKPWESVDLRVLLAAAWPYEQAVGNSSIPAVYQCINNTTVALADRSYLPATPRDLNLLAGAGLGCFGVESKHPARDFDIVATSISYPVLSMSFVKQLTISGLPARWRDRDPDAGAGSRAQWPMVMVGGLSYGAPEVLAPVVDCWWLGEAEDEPGNPGIAAVCERVAAMKAAGAWAGERVGCYDELAREFGFLYFPRHITVHYGARDRTAVGVGPHPSKQVIGWTATLPGLKLPLRRRHVRDLDAIAPLDAPPLLYADPALGAGDLEVGRGSVSADSHVLIEGEGLRSLRTWQGDALHPHGADLGKLRCDVAGQLADVTHILANGVRPVVAVRSVGGHGVVCTPDHEISVVRGPAVGSRATHGSYVAPEDRPPRSFEFWPGCRLQALADQPRVWVRADQLVPGEDYLPVHYGQNVWAPLERPLDTDIAPEGWGSRWPQPQLPSLLDEDVAWLLGMLAGDTSIRSNGDRASTKSVYLRMRTEDPGVTAKAAQVLHRLFGREIASYARDPAKPDCRTFEIRSTVVLRWLARNFGITDRLTRRRVPDAVLGSPRSVVAAYLSGFYDSDGTYDDRTGRPSWCSQSVDLIRVVSLLMLNLGAPCSWRVNRHAPRRMVDGPGDAVLAKVQGLQAVDGDWDWLQPSHTRRLPQVRRWQQQMARRNGREAFQGVIYSPVASVGSAGQAATYDAAVADLFSFTADGIHVHNCPAWCSFCALSYRQKPYRQRSVDYTVAHAKALRANMGSVRLTPFSPDFPMHTQRKALVAALLEQVSDEVDASTMRVDDFIADPEFITLQVAGGMHTVTLGVEGTSQRMRDLVGKGTADADICEAVTRGIAAGIRRFKLFMISGLPGEDEGDVYRILDLAKNLADIRESMGQPTVRIQLSWTPLMVEANTPMQWFAPTAASRVLGDVFDELRELGIDFKLGAKAEPNKALFFQLAHRASRDVGEALVDAMTEVDTACWGGVPRTFAATLEAALRRHGFANGSGDCFDERAKPDMFGWEFIDQGINVELLWTTYLQMREFAEATTSHSYDTAYSADFHGNEWTERCDTRCLGKSCGACDYTDLRIRTGYLRAVDRATPPGTVVPVDQRSQAVRIRARLVTPDRYRMVGNDHHRFALRRAAHRAQAALESPAAAATSGGAAALAGRSVRFASDTFAHRAFTAGVDYAEFALTRHLSDDALAAYLAAMAAELAPWRRLHAWTRHPVNARGLTTDVDTQLVDLALDVDPTTLTARLADWSRRPHIPIRCLVVGGYFAPATETVNAHDHVDALWAVRDGHQARLRMLLRGRPSPYAVAAALLGRPSWLDLARHVAVRRDVFLTPGVGGPTCPDCGRVVASDPLGRTAARCPPCHDTGRGTVIATTHRLERTPA